MNNPFINTLAPVLFYVVLCVLLILWVVKKRKQIRFIKDQELDELREAERNKEDLTDDSKTL